MSPRNPHEDDQPDTMDQGVHILISYDRYLPLITCDCGAIVETFDWAAHCESEGE